MGTESRETMFNAITGGEQRMGVDEWMTFSLNHVTKKIPTIDYHAVDFASLDNFIMTLFTECDMEGKGKITFDQFDTLATRAASVPRFYGLAPEGNARATRKEIFDNMAQHDGYVTFGDFVQWVFKHTKVMLKNPTAKATDSA